ncbi:MAG: type II secretion system major pseudopilin GspG [Bdellovibrionales bacterium]
MPFGFRIPEYKNNARAGFTILELLVVLAILGILIGLVAPTALRQLGTAKHKVAQQSIARISEVLDLYKLDTGGYPTTEQGLEALVAQPAGVTGWNGPYLKPVKIPLDPWNRPFQYRAPSQRADHAYDLFTYGAEGQPNGTGESATIMNE